MDNSKKLTTARQLLCLGEEATINEVNQAYHSLSLQYHPDKCGDADKGACEEKFKKITDARNLLIGYCMNYRFSFKDQDIQPYQSDKELDDHLRRFYWDWYKNGAK